MAKDTNMAGGGNLGQAQVKQLKSFGERVANLTKERAEINESIGEVMDEAREAGFDPKIIRKAVKRLMSDEAALTAEEEMIDSYVEAMKGLPLFEAANARKAA